MARIEQTARSGKVIAIEMAEGESPADAAKRLVAAVEAEGGFPEPPPPDPKTRPLTLMEQWVVGLANDDFGRAADRILVYRQITICKAREQEQRESKMGFEFRSWLEQQRKEAIAPKFVVVGDAKAPHRAMFYDVAHGIDRIGLAPLAAALQLVTQADPGC